MEINYTIKCGIYSTLYATLDSASMKKEKDHQLNNKYVN